MLYNSPILHKKTFIEMRRIITESRAFLLTWNGNETDYYRESHIFINLYCNETNYYRESHIFFNLFWNETDYYRESRVFRLLRYIPCFAALVYSIVLMVIMIIMRKIWEASWYRWHKLNFGYLLLIHLNKRGNNPSHLIYFITTHIFKNAFYKALLWTHIKRLIQSSQKVRQKSIHISVNASNPHNLFRGYISKRGKRR